MLEYKDINLESLNDEEYRRATHTIKGVSASAGALNLHAIAKQLDETQNKDYLPEFYKELSKVIDEIEDKIISTEKKIQKKELDPKKRDELFTQLKEAVSTKRAKNCKPVIEEFEKYSLSKEDENLYQEVKQFIKKFKFKQAMEIL